ncbi:MAG: thioredoxin family protein [Aquificaceae bacterium]|nr:thioredoxin family protein [Aquificaceae bacterium]
MNRAITASKVSKVQTFKFLEKSFEPCQTNYFTVAKVIGWIKFYPMLVATLLLCKVLLFEQAGCASCKASYRELSGYQNIRVEIYDINRNRELAKSYGVVGAPTLVFIKGGQEIGRVYGYIPHIIKSLADKC